MLIGQAKLAFCKYQNALNLMKYRSSLFACHRMSGTFAGEAASLKSTPFEMRAKLEIFRNTWVWTQTLCCNWMDMRLRQPWCIHSRLGAGR